MSSYGSSLQLDKVRVLVHLRFSNSSGMTLQGKALSSLYNVDRDLHPPPNKKECTYLSYGESFIIQFSFLNKTIEWRTRNRIEVPTHNNGAEAAVFLMGNTGNLCQKHCQLGQFNVTSPWVIQQMCVSYTDGRGGSAWNLGLQEQH